jgi:hypothetical protein
MRKTLKVESTEPADDELLRAHLDGPDWKFAVADLDAELRRCIKYEACPKRNPGWQDARDMLHRILSDRCLELE